MLFNNKIMKTLVLITQVGFSLMIPVFLLLIISILIYEKFNIDFRVLFIVVGILAGFRNAAMLIYGYLKSIEDDNKNVESELLKKHKKKFDNQIEKI